MWKQKIDQIARTKTVFITDFYQKYRYKKRFMKYFSNGVYSNIPPYVKKSESSDHKYSLYYHEWREVIRAYFGILERKLAEGCVYEFPFDLGIVHLVRMPINHKRKKYTLCKFIPRTMGWFPGIVWKRKDARKMFLKECYIFSLSRMGWERIYKRYSDDPSLLMKLPEQ